MMSEMAEQELSERIRRQIEAVRRGESTKLNFRGAGLKEIPAEVFTLTNLTHLTLGNNELRELPERIRHLPKLRRIDLTRNPVQRVADVPGLHLDGQVYLRLMRSLTPEHIAGLGVQARDLPAFATTAPRLPTLAVLEIGGTAEEGLTSAIDCVLKKAGGLRVLTLRGVSLEGLPSALQELRSLTALTVREAGVRECPEWICELHRLVLLELAGNPLEALPKRFRELQELRYLFITENAFRKLPEVLFELGSLEYLHVDSEHGSIREIPPDILRLEQLRSLSLKGHPIETPPPEIVSASVKGIKNYWRQRQEQAVDYLCEAKLLVVGEPGAGKTSLARKIQDPDYQLRDDTTEGIQVDPWSFPTTIHVDGKAIPRDYRVNIWDFGGQEIYKATHQFFLTRRSLYVLVADDRKEDTDFWYWLEIVELLSDGSPVIVIQNEKHDRRREIDFVALRAQYPNLRETYRVNLANNRGLEAAMRGIQREMEALQHIGTPLPANWKRVREALELDPRDYISQEEYLDIAEREGLRRPEDKLQVSDYLHHLGICLHFQDDPILKHIIILKPRWGTDAVYRALDDKLLFERHGRFGPADLARIWSEARYTGKQDELLRLMMKFQLCYQVPDTQTYIAPQLLPTNQPAYDWPETANLVFRYEYTFMPKGIVTRLIVAMHHRIAHDLVWKTGVIFERDHTRAEVIEDYGRRHIRVRATGADARVLAGIIDDHLQRIHDSFPKLKSEKYVPCNCPKCAASAEPYLFASGELKDFAATGDLIQCRSSRKMIDARELIGEQRTVPDREEPRKVFVSYKHATESTALVDLIESTLRDHKITLLRDRNEVLYRDSFREFMERLGAGDAIVVVLSKAYLESPNCVFELTAIAEHRDLRKRVYPIVLSDANIHSAEGRLSYGAYWKQRADQLRAEMLVPGAEEDLRDYRRYERIAETLRTLGDMNALSADGSMQTLVKELEKRLT
jgi:internalin A